MDYDNPYTTAERDQMFADAKAGRAFFLVSLFHDSEDDDDVYGRLVCVRAKDPAHVRRALPPLLQAGEVIDDEEGDDGIEQDPEDMFRWYTKTPPAQRQGSVFDLCAEAVCNKCGVGCGHHAIGESCSNNDGGKIVEVIA
jgi:hypothetical protein